MGTLTMNLNEFLIKVVLADYEMKEILGDEACFHMNVEFNNLEIDEPTVEEQARIKSVCEAAAQKQGQSITLTEGDLSDIWKMGVERHYTRSYLENHFEAMKQAIETKVRDSFKHLPVFFEAELLQEGRTVDTVKSFEVLFDWKNNLFTIEGDLSALEVILVEVINVACQFGYDNVEEFRRVNESDQTARLLRHLPYLRQVEGIYGTPYDFFFVRGLDELDGACFGDFKVTDDELIEAMEDY